MNATVTGIIIFFSTRIAAIRREVLIRLGGFNEAFRQMEDVELTYRIAKRYAIIFAPDVRVHHEFEEFWPVARKYFWRSFYWTKLYKVRKKFDPVATTMSETITAATGVGAIGVIVAGTILYFLLPFTWIRIVTLASATILFLFIFFSSVNFCGFVIVRKGLGLPSNQFSQDSRSIS